MDLMNITHTIFCFEQFYAIQYTQYTTAQRPSIYRVVVFSHSPKTRIFSTHDLIRHCHFHFLFLSAAGSVIYLYAAIPFLASWLWQQAYCWYCGFGWCLLRSCGIWRSKANREAASGSFFHIKKQSFRTKNRLDHCFDQSICAASLTPTMYYEL